MTSLQKEVWDILKTIPDPELGVSLVDLGLIYNVKVDTENRVFITMTLTTIGCPLYDVIEKEITEKVGKIPLVTDVELDLTFDPPWSLEKMSDTAKAHLGVD